MIFDPFYLILAAPGLVLSLWASWRVKSNFKKYSRVRSGRNITGAQAAQELLSSAGISDVRIVRSKGLLSLKDLMHQSRQSQTCRPPSRE